MPTIPFPHQPPLCHTNYHHFTPPLFHTFNYFINYFMLAKKLFPLIILVLSFPNCFLLHLMKSAVFISSSVFFLSSMLHNHSGYSESSNATGSSPFFLTFKFNTVPAGQDDLETTFLNMPVLLNDLILLIFIHLNILDSLI
jgi:hypothetical protein